VERGERVETRDNFFVEGVWSGEFSQGAFDECEAFFGSGAVHKSGQIVFVPSAATVDYLYFKETKESFFCSNSLPFLLAALHDQLVEFNPVYGFPLTDFFGSSRRHGVYARYRSCR
jgi:hypothetical protein